MAKKTAKNKPTTEQAIALHMMTTTITGIGEAFGRILKSVRELTGNRLVSAKDVKDVINSWVNFGWAKKTKNYIRIIGGHLKLSNLARAGAASA
jgi:hypothetical protein